MEVMKVVSAREMRRIDEATINGFGIPGEVLMAYAGRVVANYIIDEFPGISDIAVVCGSGNNGGDGFVVAYLLFNSGRNVRVYFAGAEEKLSASARIYHSLCRNAGVFIEPFPDEQSENALAGTMLVVDALAGTGFSGIPRGVLAKAISAINRSGAIVLSIDVPSGLPSDGDAPEGEAVFADITVTIGLPKISLVTYPGKRWAGKLVLADIGFPRALTESDSLKAELIDEEYVCSRFPSARDADAHKNSWGHVLFVGGFDGMEGALLLAASAFFETGAGIATALTTPNTRNIVAGKVPELMTASFGPESEWNSLVEKCNHIKNNSCDGLCSEIKKMLGDFFSSKKSFGFAVIGPGMGRSMLSKAVFDVLMESAADFGLSRILIDGDGLYHFAEYLKQKGRPVVDVLITPHFLEASRICGASVDDIKRNRFAAAPELSHAAGATVLLKGPASIVCDGTCWRINTTGNPALATAGSGDVLCGIVASLASRNLSLLDAAALGAWLHGRAADLYVRKTRKHAMKASDIIAFIGEALRSANEIKGEGSAS